MIQFAAPAYLWLLLPAAVGLWLSFRHVHGMVRGRKVISFIVRSILIASLVIALAGPEARRENSGTSTIFVVDRSDSVSESDKKSAVSFINSAVEKLSPDDEVGIIAFGSDAMIEVAPSNLRSLTRILSKTEGSGTDLAAAIRLASASHSDGKAKRIVVITDGNETDGDAAEAAAAAAVADVQIDYVALGNNSEEAEVSFLNLQAPTEISLGQTFALRAIVDSNTSGKATLRLDRDGLAVAQKRVELTPGRNQFLLEDVVEAEGFHRYRAYIDPERDSDNRNNSGATFIAVKGRSRLLVIQKEATPGPLVTALREQGLLVDVYGPAGVPTRGDQLQGYDAVIFNDINASMVTAHQMTILQAAIRDTGVGFAMIGGEDSFLPGGWYGTPIAEVLPVDLDIRQRKTFPSTSILIVIDASGSMAMSENGVQKIRLAAKAAETTVNLMSPRDRIGVAGSTDGIQFVAKMQTAENKPGVISQIRKLSTGGGGIYAEPSMSFAQKVLNAEKSKVRHLILLADGADTDMQDGCIAIALAMRARKITTSVIAIGDGKDVPFLKQLARSGGGNFYMAEKASQLASIFTQDAAIMSRSAIEEGVFLPKSVAGEEILSGIDPNTIPALYAYCLSSDRPLSTVGMRTHKDDPLLATWQYGLGTTLAFTSDAQAQWATKWVTWQQFGQFWAQAMRTITRRATLNDYQVTAKLDGSKGVLEVKAFDTYGNPLNSMNAKVRVSTPEGKSIDVPVSQRAPGVYEGEFSANELGSYVVTVAEEGSKRVSTSGFSIPYPMEYKRHSANLPLLERISKTTGGMALTTPELAIRPATDTGYSISELWAYFVLFAGLLLPFDVAARRIAIPFGAVAAKAAGVFKKRERPAPRVDPRVERLQKAKERATATQAAAAEVAEPSSKPGKEPVSAATRLLEAKRRRGELD